MMSPSVHSGGQTSSYMLRDVNGEPSKLFVLFATSEVATEEYQNEWKSIYQSLFKDQSIHFPGTANYMIEYDFQKNQLAQDPVFVGISLSNTDAGFDAHNVPSITIIFVLHWIIIALVGVQRIQEYH